MTRQPELALTVLRVVVGLLTFWHGFQKIFTVGLLAVTAQFQAGGVPLPLLSAPLVAIVELVGGLLLILGLGARGLAGILALLTLLTWLAPLTLGADLNPATLNPATLNQMNWTAFERPVLLLAGYLALVLGGPGALAAAPPKAKKKAG